MKRKRTKKPQGTKHTHNELTELADIANKQHSLVCKGWKDLLYHARLAGEALNKVRPYCKHGQWQRWLKANFDGSYETAQVYRRIAAKWHDPRLRQARRSGVKLNSLKKVLEVLKEMRDQYPIPNSLLNEDGTINLKEAQEQGLRSFVRKLFADAIKKLCHDELVIFEECFEELWEKFYERILYPATCQVLELDLNEMLVARWETLKRVRAEERKKLKKDGQRDEKRWPASDSIEYTIPNIRYRQEKVKEERKREKVLRRRKRRSAEITAKRMKPRKTS
jgi:hypothetical protein